MSQRRRVVELYKKLIYLGRDYPDPNFRQKLHGAFKKQAKVTDPEKIEQCIAKGEYVAKELEALYSLKKYRTMKRRYYNEEAK
uniref:CSON012459 protein n=1 Tax=Culicoides sonorensis TaxID=179676 RepID=A0A336N0S0_CULSO